LCFGVFDQITQDVKDAKVALTPSDSFNSGDHSELLPLPSQEPWLQPLSKQSDPSAAGTTENESGKQPVEKCYMY
jgi:hypothetical protein